MLPLDGDATQQRHQTISPTVRRRADYLTDGKTNQLLSHGKLVKQNTTVTLSGLASLLSLQHWPGGRIPYKSHGKTRRVWETT
jgi:hypothetical protein